MRDSKKTLYPRICIRNCRFIGGSTGYDSWTESFLDKKHPSFFVLAAQRRLKKGPLSPVVSAFLERIHIKLKGKGATVVANAKASGPTGAGETRTTPAGETKNGNDAGKNPYSDGSDEPYTDPDSDDHEPILFSDLLIIFPGMEPPKSQQDKYELMDDKAKDKVGLVLGLVVVDSHGHGPCPWPPRSRR